MKVQVSGKHVDVGAALRERVIDEVNQSIGRVFERGGSADVVVSREGHAFRVDCSVLLATGQPLESHALAADAHTAFSSALHKIESRVRRYKQRLKSHAQASAARQAETAAYFVLRSPDEASDEIWEDEVGVPESSDPPAALVIAETEKSVRNLTVSQAVLELDLTDSQTIVFRNAAHGGLSVVYRRPDGNIGWIDPERTSNSRTGKRGEPRA
ncbi:MAG: ribosome hibernation-promoting factor, HPF/YfiA family [Phenylobacterium sp.]